MMLQNNGKNYLKEDWTRYLEVRVNATRTPNRYKRLEER